MNLKPRAHGIINAVFRHRALNRKQIEIAADFQIAEHTRAQKWLTALVNDRWLDRIDRRSVNEPAVYKLGRRSVNGSRLMRAEWGEVEFRRSTGPIGPLEHTLAINDVRVRVERACRELGWDLLCCLRPQDLHERMASACLEPDSFFIIQRTVDRTPRKAGLFLEVEKSVKASGAVEGKLKKYTPYYRSGAYMEDFKTFGVHGMRILVVFTNELRGPSESRIEHGLESAVRTGATMARFASLESLKASHPVAVLTAELWRQPGVESPVSLFLRDSVEGGQVGGQAT